MAGLKLLDLPNEIIFEIVLPYLSDKDLLHLMLTCPTLHTLFSDNYASLKRFKLTYDSPFPAPPKMQVAITLHEHHFFGHFTLSLHYRLRQKMISMLTSSDPSPLVLRKRQSYRNIMTLMIRICPAAVNGVSSEGHLFDRVDTCILLTILRIHMETLRECRLHNKTNKGRSNAEVLQYLIENSNVVFECSLPRMNVRPISQRNLQMLLAPRFLHLDGRLQHSWQSFLEYRAAVYSVGRFVYTHESEHLLGAQQAPSTKNVIVERIHLLRLIHYWHTVCSSPLMGVFLTKFKEIPALGFPTNDPVFSISPNVSYEENVAVFRLRPKWSCYTAIMEDREILEAFAEMVETNTYEPDLLDIEERGFSSGDHISFEPTTRLSDRDLERFSISFGRPFRLPSSHMDYVIKGKEAGHKFDGFARVFLACHSMGLGLFQWICMIKSFCVPFGEEISADSVAAGSLTEFEDHSIISQAIIFPKGELMMGRSHLVGDEDPGFDFENSAVPWWRGVFLAYPAAHDEIEG